MDFIKSFGSHPVMMKGIFYICKLMSQNKNCTCVDVLVNDNIIFYQWNKVIPTTTNS